MVFYNLLALTLKIKDLRISIICLIRFAKAVTKCPLKLKNLLPKDLCAFHLPLDVCVILTSLNMTSVPFA